MTTPTLDGLRQALPDAARDIKLNLASVLESSTALSPAQRWGVALASAFAVRNDALRDALLGEAEAKVGGAVVEDARIAATLMAMNNVYYRFRHLVGKPSYADKPPRLRMNRLAQPATSKVDLELYCLAVSALHACETCVRSHEKVVVEGGLTEDHVHEAVRIAAVVHAAAQALELGVPVAAPGPLQVAE